MSRIDRQLIHPKGGRNHSERIAASPSAFVGRARLFFMSARAISALRPIPCGKLFTLSDDKAQSCEAANGIARTHLEEIDRKIGDLAALRTELDRVIEIKTVTFRKGNAN
ncbi:MerR family DNA-binding protein [Sphingorhabdus sp.]|uniref:MerR family DNA-binding protein n=1 Tax=Sphingorhabdus sp. TaxID=1902408 RepID=UPI00333F3891